MSGIVLSLFQEAESCSFPSPQYASTEEEKKRRGKGRKVKEKGGGKCGEERKGEAKERNGGIGEGRGKRTHY